MKILMAIESKDPKRLGDHALRWCGRTGFELRVFIPKKRRRAKYEEAILDANYNWYMAIPTDIIVTRTSPKEYAQQHGFDLLLTIPEELFAWRKGTQFKDSEIWWVRKAVGAARLEFGAKPKMRIKRFANGCIMERL